MVPCAWKVETCRNNWKCGFHWNISFIQIVFTLTVLLADGFRY